ncbi:MAG: hypothetical protein ACP5EP_11460 [Acidobacteriaceae bacterium]
MYSEKVIQLTIDDFARRNGWEPKFHTVAECDEMTQYINSLGDVETSKSGSRSYWYWKDGKAPSQSKVKYIQRWVQNERFLCSASAEYFVTRYVYIRAANTQLTHFELRIAQKIFLSFLAKCDDLQVAIQLFILKARQLGISSVVAAFFLHRIQFIANTYAIMASVQVEQSKKLKNMLDTAQEKLPFWLRVGQTSTKASEPRWSNGSLLSVQAGGQEVGIGQGTSPSCLHISEVGDYLNPKRTLDEGLFPACHQLPSLFMVLEGTGSMATTWQKESWDLYSSNKGRFTAFFIPPACATDLYPPESWLRQHPVPEPWESHITEPTRRMRRRGQLFVRSTDYLWQFLGQGWEMPKEFQWFWQYGYEEAIAKHAEREFLSQNAVTPADAFQSKDDPVFTGETIELITKAKEPAYLQYAITGKTILMGNDNVPYQPQPTDIDPNGQPIVLDWKGYDDNEYRWTLVPLLPFDDSTDEACFDKLLVFFPPEAGADYAIAIDTASGLNKPNEDRASLSVSKNGHGKEPDIQVASFTSLRVNSPQMARIAAAVAVLYGTDGNGHITSANPMGVKFVIEQVRKSGDECQNQLKIMGFLDHHVMLRIDKKGNVLPDGGTSEGWFTRAYSRPYLLDRFVDAVNTGWLRINDPIAIRQLGTFVRKYIGGEGRSEMIHLVGQHDDNLFALAMGWTTFHELENSAVRIQSRWPTIRKEEQAQDDSWCFRGFLIP